MEKRVTEWTSTQMNIMRKLCYGRAMKKMEFHKRDVGIPNLDKARTLGIVSLGK